jgi:hypothetical protein
MGGYFLLAAFCYYLYSSSTDGDDDSSISRAKKLLQELEAQDLERRSKLPKDINRNFDIWEPGNAPLQQPGNLWTSLLGFFLFVLIIMVVLAIIWYIISFFI